MIMFELRNKRSRDIVQGDTKPSRGGTMRKKVSLFNLSANLSFQRERHNRLLFVHSTFVPSVICSCSLRGPSILKKRPSLDAEQNGTYLRHGDPRQSEFASGAISPISKPGTPVLGGSAQDFQQAPAGRAGSSQLTANTLDRLSLQEPGKFGQISGRASGNTTPGKERPIGGSAAMKKVRFCLGGQEYLLHLF